MEIEIVIVVYIVIERQLSAYTCTGQVYFHAVTMMYLYIVELFLCSLTFSLHVCVCYTAQVAPNCSKEIHCT